MTDRALLRTIVKPRYREATEEEFALFEATCARTGLDPLANQVYTIFRSSNSVEKMAIQSTIDGFRVIAERSGDYLGGDSPQWCGADGEWKDVWLAEAHPVAARVTVHKAAGGQVASTSVVAHWKEYAPTGNAAQMWTKMPALMLAKVAEALALRRAFPMVLSGIYTSEEMAQATPERIPDPEAPTEPEVITDPDYIEALKVACKDGQLNWGKIKECYASAELTAPEAFDARFSALDAEQAAALLAAIEDRVITDTTDVPYPAAEVAPPEPTDDSDVLLPPPSQGSGDAASPVSDDAPAEPTPLPAGAAPIDTLLAADAKREAGEELTEEETALLEGAVQEALADAPSATPEVFTTATDLEFLKAYAKHHRRLSRTAAELGVTTEFAKAAAEDLRGRFGVRTGEALLERATALGHLS